MKNFIIDTNIFCIFIFVLIVSANFLAELFPCRLQYVLRNNMVVKHIFGLFTMIFFVVLSSGIKDKNILNIVKNAVFLYIIFMLITKCQKNLFFIILLLLGITYITNIIKQQEIESNKTESTEEKANENVDSIYDDIIYILYIIIIIFIILGVLLYMGEKKIEYKKDFNYITFFIGQSSCKGQSPKVNLIEAIKHAFK
jgi:hypothetical protein